MKNVNVADVITKVRAGEEEAMHTLYEISRPLFNAVASGYRNQFKPDVSEEDFFLKSIEKVWRKSDQFDTTQSYSAWFKTIADNEIKKYLRGEKADKRNHIQESMYSSGEDGEEFYLIDYYVSSDSAEAIVFEKEKETLIHEYLENILSKAQYDAFVLCVMDGMKASEAAEALNVDVTKVSNDKNRSLNKLKKALNEDNKLRDLLNLPYVA